MSFGRPKGTGKVHPEVKKLIIRAYRILQQEAVHGLKVGVSRPQARAQLYFGVDEGTVRRWASDANNEVILF